MGQEITIIGGGWCAGLIDLGKARGLVIGVNDAALLAPKVDIILSMDRLWVEHRWERFANLRKTTYLREGTLRNISGWETRAWINQYKCDIKTTRPSADPSQLNGDNSGSVAGNLAYHFRPRKLWLMGIDLSRGPNGEPYWYPPYEWNLKGATKLGKYREWAHNLTPLAAAFAKIGCEVICVTNSKEMRMFNKMSPERFNALY